MSSAETDTNVSRNPACDSCRSRKIKCDRQVPCSSCRQWKIECINSLKARERRKRVGISHRYDTEFRDLNRKLENLSVTLQSIVDKPKASEPSSVHALQQQLADVLATVKQEEEDQNFFEGDSSFYAHSDQALKSFGDGLGNAPLDSGLGTRDTPAKSSTTTGSSPSAVVSTGAISHYIELSRLPLPPSATILAALRVCKGLRFPTNYFASPPPSPDQLEQSQGVNPDFPFINNEILTSLCQKLYFPTEDYTLTTFTLANACLFYLMRDMIRIPVQEHGLAKKDLLHCAEICSANLYVAIKRWPLSMDGSYENILALTMAIFILIEGCHVSFAWNVAATAARLCKNSGYHRETTYNSSLSPAEKSQRKWLFWALYGFDHALALNFGQPPNIQDYDITLDIPRMGHGYDALSQQLWLWVDLARWEGDVYEQLYSAKAQRASQKARIEKAQELANVGYEFMEKVKASLIEPFPTPDCPEDYQRGVTASVQVVMYSILTLIFKVIPPAAMKSSHPLQFSEDCVAAARGALTTLNQAWTHIQEEDDGWRIFMHWSLIGCPFLAFIVMFASAMNNNMADFELLGNSVHTVQSIAQRSPNVTKLLRACQSFYRIAVDYHNQNTKPTHFFDAAHSEATTQVPVQEAIPVGQESFESDSSGFNYMDFSMQNWDQMLGGWELGLGAETAREMTSYFEQFPQISGFPGPTS